MKIIKENIFPILMICIFLFFAATALASDDDDHGCPPGHEHLDSCDNTGPPGADGEDGIDGVDGIDGIDGIDGVDGINGLNGIAGLNGIVDYSTINKTISKNFREWGHWAAAMQSIQIHLPQESSQRFTLAGSTVNGQTGIGAGYAYKFDRDDNLSVTAGIGTSGGEEVGVLSVGFEFGAERNALQNNLKSVEQNNLKSVESRIDALEQDFNRQKELWREDAKRCADDLDRATEINDRIEERFMECLQK